MESFTETSLECLEIIEETDTLDGITITQAMKEAYCAVAVESCVKYLEACPEKNIHGLFDDATNKIWRGRIRKMLEAAAEGRKSNLFTADLVRWKDLLDSARWDAEVCETLMKMDTRQVAIQKVRVYLNETFSSMGPPFLELVDVWSQNKGLEKVGVWSQNKGLESSRGNQTGETELAAIITNDNGVSESVLVSDQMNICKEGLPCKTNTTQEGLVVPDESALNNAAICMEEAPVAGGNHESEQLGKRVLLQRTNEVIQKGKQPLEGNHDAPSPRRGVKIIDVEERGPAAVSSKDHSASTIQVEKHRRSVMSSSLELRALVEGPLPDALHKSGVVRSKLARKGVAHEPPPENQSTVANVPKQNTCRSIVLYQPISDNFNKQSPASRNNVQRPNLMERNSTTHAFNDLPGGSPKKRSRKVRWWSSEEVGALRDGVKKFGKGNWKPILKCYSAIFEKQGRTEVDLKDKWRTLMQSS